MRHFSNLFRSNQESLVEPVQFYYLYSHTRIDHII
nr:MAG TPA: hypothetical protein [Caudoviricetes sp.]